MMSFNFHRWLLWLLLAGVGLTAPALYAEETAQAKLLELSAKLEPSSAVVPGERVRLVIKVATPRWFTAGTRLKLPEVPGLILLQNQDFASNATERRGTESWSVQRWSIDAFATQAGSIVIPPVSVQVAVSETPAKEYRTTLQTEPLTLQVEIPEELAAIDLWIASPLVTLEQTIEGNDAVPLGGAIRRSVVVTGRDVVAMLLPSLPRADDPLLQTYRDPPVLRNRANRGSLTAERREATTWIASAPGEAVLPRITVHWWNTETKVLTQLVTDPVSITITGEPLARPMSQGEWLTLALWAGLAIVMVFVIYIWQRAGLSGWLAVRASAIAQHGRQSWRRLRNPVLADRLNPGGTPGASSASEPREH